MWWLMHQMSATNVHTYHLSNIWWFTHQTSTMNLLANVPLNHGDWVSNFCHELLHCKGGELVRGLSMPTKSMLRLMKSSTWSCALLIEFSHTSVYQDRLPWSLLYAHWSDMIIYLNTCITSYWNGHLHDKSRWL